MREAVPHLEKRKEAAMSTITERENALMVYNHEIPEWIPNLFDSFYFAGNATGNETGLLNATQDGTPFEDIWGQQWIMEAGAGTPLPDPNRKVLDTLENWRDAVQVPDPDTWDWDKLVEMDMANYDGTRLLTYFCEEGAFDRLRGLMGFENALCALLEEPEECIDFLGAVTDFKVKIIEKVAEYYKPDVFMYTDDVATARGLFMSLDTYRDVIAIHEGKVFNAIREHGMIAEKHTCGKMDAIAFDLAKNGCQSLFPAQASNDLIDIKAKYGNEMVIAGGFNSQGAPGFDGASEELMRLEARRMVDMYAPGGGFICHPVILGGPHFSVCALQTQKWFMDEFYSYTKDYYSKPENRVFDVERARKAEAFYAEKQAAVLHANAA